MSKLFWKSIFAILLLSALSCREEAIVEQPLPPSGTTVTLLNTSFELGAGPTLAGWTINDSSLVDFSPDVPPTGENWSLTVGAKWAPSPPAVSRSFVALDGTHIYELRVWAKRTGVGGTAAITWKQANTPVTLKSVPITDSTWTAYTILDTLTGAQGDSVGIRLAGAISQLAPGTTYFDLCVFERLE